MKIIAEIGSNCRTIDEAYRSIRGAKDCGANMVKFQWIDHGDLSPESTKRVLHKFWIPQLAEYCEQIEIEFMCTAFSPKNYEYLNKFVQRHKIASCEVTDIEILDTVNSFKKPVIVSTGCVDGFFLKNYVLPHLKNCDVTIMFCVSDYPAKVIDFVHFEELRQICGNSYTYGYSDHSTDALIIPRKAKFHGAAIIEKHVNFIDDMESDDVAHSLDQWSFGLMVRSLREEPINPNETVSFVTRTHYLRRPFATKTIHAEETIVIGENVKFYRGYDACGMPFDLTRRKYVANQLIEKGELVTFGKVSE